MQHQPNAHMTVECNTRVSFALKSRTQLHNLLKYTRMSIWNTSEWKKSHEWNCFSSVVSSIMQQLLLARSNRSTVAIIFNHSHSIGLPMAFRTQTDIYGFIQRNLYTHRVTVTVDSIHLISIFDNDTMCILEVQLARCEITYLALHVTIDHGEKTITKRWHCFIVDQTALFFTAHNKSLIVLWPLIAICHRNKKNLQRNVNRMT